MEPWRAVDAHHGGPEAQKGVLKGLYCRQVVADSYQFEEKLGPDPH
jgi:hypothetical protein